MRYWVMNCSPGSALWFSVLLKDTKKWTWSNLNSQLSQSNLCTLKYHLYLSIACRHAGVILISLICLFICVCWKACCLHYLDYHITVSQIQCLPINSGEPQFQLSWCFYLLKHWYNKLNIPMIPSHVQPCWGNHSCQLVWRFY